MHAPLRFVYGNLCLGGSDRDAWALFVATPHPFDGLTAADKRERFSRLASALESVEADLQILRVSRPFDVTQYTRDLLAERAPHPEPLETLASGHRQHLDDLDAREPWIAIAVRLQPAASDAAAFARDPRPRRRRWSDRVRAAVSWEEPRVLSLARLEALRVRADEAHARMAAYLEVRPARTVELQWLVRRTFCRGLGEPEVDGLHEPEALVFERNGQAMLAPLEADVLRWCDGYIDHHGRRLRVESELGVSWQAQLVVGALPERGVFPSTQLALLSAIPDGLAFPVDLSLNARLLPNGTAVRLVRRRIQDADQILRAEDDGDQGAAIRAMSARRRRATCWATCSRPAIRRCCARVSRWRSPPPTPTSSSAASPPAVGPSARSRCTARSASSSSSSASTSPASPRGPAATRTPSRSSRSPP